MGSVEADAAADEDVEIWELEIRRCGESGEGDKRRNWPEKEEENVVYLSKSPLNGKGLGVEGSCT